MLPSGLRIYIDAQSRGRVGCASLNLTNKERRNHYETNHFYSKCYITSPGVNYTYSRARYAKAECIASCVRGIYRAHGRLLGELQQSYSGQSYRATRLP